MPPHTFHGIFDAPQAKHFGGILKSALNLMPVGKTIFLVEFSADGRNFGSRDTNEISKVKHFWKLFFQCLYFLCFKLIQNMEMNLKNKNLSG
jgi:hypothetical protein